MSFIIQIRLNETLRLLKETDMTILEICYSSGFNNLSNFNRLFRKKYTQSPIEYRNRAE
jgi:AraC-like DNA-binding protein